MEYFRIAIDLKLALNVDKETITTTKRNLVFLVSESKDNISLKRMHFSIFDVDTKCKARQKLIILSHVQGKLDQNLN